MSIGQDLLNVPMGEMIRSMAFAIAEAQLKLDHASIESAEMMGGLKTIVDDQGNVTFEDSRVYFGHEYMTIAQAMVTQAGPLNPAASALVAGVQITHKEATGNDPSSTQPVTENLSVDSLAAYQTYRQTIVTQIAALKATIATEEAKPQPSLTAIDNANAKIDKWRALDAENRNLMKSVLEDQVRVPTRVSLLELGFAPVFYSFVDTIIEVRISISITQENSSTTETTDTGRSVQASTAFRGIPFLRGGLTRQRTVNTSQVNASYSSRYSYTAEGSSLLRTKLSPVPTPTILDERIHAIMDADQQRQAAELAAIQNPAPLA